MQDTSEHYEHIEPGISRFHNRYRATAQPYGEAQQQYFSTLAGARQWREFVMVLAVESQVVGVRNTKKHEGSLAPDLPVGLYETRVTRKTPAGNLTTSDYIRSSIFHDGRVVKVVSASFGRIRSRADAVALVIQKRERYYHSWSLV